MSLSPHYTTALTFFDFPTCLMFWISLDGIDQAKSEYKMLLMSIPVQSGWSLIRHRDQRLGENFNASSPFLPNISIRSRPNKVSHHEVKKQNFLTENSFQNNTHDTDSMQGILRSKSRADIWRRWQAFPPWSLGFPSLLLSSFNTDHSPKGGKGSTRLMVITSQDPISFIFSLARYLSLTKMFSKVLRRVHASPWWGAPGTTALTRNACKVTWCATCGTCGTKCGTK